MCCHLLAGFSNGLWAGKGHLRLVSVVNGGNCLLWSCFYKIKFTLYAVQTQIGVSNISSNTPRTCKF